MTLQQCSTTTDRLYYYGHCRRCGALKIHRKFVCEGYADSYKGMVDVITAGFPCQPFSVTGKRAGEGDLRNMWPQTIDVIRRVRPRYALLENVPGLLTHEYFGTVLGSLAEAGYDTKWCVLGADDVGAPHHRKRLWILAHAQSRTGQLHPRSRKPGQAKADVGGQGQDVPNPDSKRRQERRGSESIQQEQPVIECACEAMANPASNGRLPRGQSDTPKEQGGRKPDRGGIGSDLPNANSLPEERPAVSWPERGYWESEPGVGRVVNGMAFRRHQLEALGNGQVPLSMALAAVILSNGAFGMFGGPE